MAAAAGAGMAVTAEDAADEAAAEAGTGEEGAGAELLLPLSFPAGGICCVAASGSVGAAAAALSAAMAADAGTGRGEGSAALMQPPLNSPPNMPFLSSTSGGP